MSNTEISYEEEIKIDQHALDEEWLHQPAIFFRISVQCAKAEARAKRAKEKIAVVEAEAYTRARNKLDREGEKITEALVKATMAKDAELLKANDEYQDLSEEWGILKAGVEAFQHRKSALENLVKLNLAGYYSSPSDIKQDEKSSEFASTKQNAKLSKKLNKKED